jgi:hypothetical protein
MGRGEHGSEPYSGSEGGLPGGGSDLRGIEEIEGVLRELATPPSAPLPAPSRRKKRGGRGRSEPTAAAPRLAPSELQAEHLFLVLGDARAFAGPGSDEIHIGGADMGTSHGADGIGRGTIPEVVPLAFDAIADAEEDAGAAPYPEVTFARADTAAGCPSPADGSGNAVAVPMTVHDAALVSLGENVKQVTMLIESVGRTLDAQSQRSLRLMERLEHVALALETLPEDADRSLEAMDSVGESIKAHQAPLDRMSEGIARLPHMFERLEESELRTRDMFSRATKVMAGRLAASHRERRREEERRGSHLRWHVLVGTTCAALAFAGGLFFSGADVGTDLRTALGRAILGGDGNIAFADGNDGEKAPWRVTGLRGAVPEGQNPEPPADMPDGEWFGVDEEPGC